MEAFVSSLDYDGRTFRFPFRGLLRCMNAAERATLREEILRVDGVTVPVLVRPNGDVIDGDNRLHLAREVGLPLSKVPIEVRDVGEEEARSLCVSLNTARRHLSPEEARAARARRRQQEKDLAQQGLSTREIAEQVGCAQRTVVNDLQNGLAEQSCSANPFSATTARVKALHEEGLPVRAIATEVGLTRGEVRGIVRKLEEEQPRPKRRPGRPRGSQEARAQARAEARALLDKLEAEEAAGADAHPRPGAAAAGDRACAIRVKLSDPDTLVRWFEKRLADPHGKRRLSDVDRASWREALTTILNKLATAER